MKNQHSISPFTPVSTTEQHVRSRYAELKLAVPYAQLRDHIAAQLSRADAQPLVNMACVSSKFFECCVKPTLPSDSRTQRSMIRRIGVLVDALEQAATYCVLATLPVPKPLRAILDEALTYCHQYDELKTQHEQFDKAARQHRQKGGHDRHEHHRRLKRLTIRFLRTKAPTCQWKSKVHAAEVIGQHLAELAAKHQLNVSKSPETWAKNVVNMVRDDPQTAEAFRRYRSPRRSNRPRGTSC